MKIEKRGMVMIGKLKGKIFRISVMCFIILFLSCFVQMDVKASTRGAYQAYVNKHINKKKCPNLKCILYDINKDGRKELIVQYESGVRYAYRIYTYRKGKVKKMHKGEFFGASGIYYKKGKKELFILFTNGASDNEYCSYQMKGGKLKKNKSYRAVFNMETEDAKYFFGKKRISQKKYDRFSEKLKPIPEHVL